MQHPLILPQLVCFLAKYRTNICIQPAPIICHYEKFYQILAWLQPKKIITAGHLTYSLFRYRCLDSNYQSNKFFKLNLTFNLKILSFILELDVFISCKRQQPFLYGPTLRRFYNSPKNLEIEKEDIYINNGTYLWVWKI